MIQRAPHVFNGILGENPAVHVGRRQLWQRVLGVPALDLRRHTGRTQRRIPSSRCLRDLLHRLGQAISYLLRHWERLTLLAGDGKTTYLVVTSVLCPAETS